MKPLRLDRLIQVLKRVRENTGNVEIEVRNDAGERVILLEGDVEVGADIHGYVTIKLGV